ncbi:MAG: metallophosphoesterase [Rudaea sp.]
MSYDIIGDIHGHADVLKALLRKMGYRERDGAWRHADRTALFIGDFVDRGPNQLETVSIVRAMVEAGAALAIMGNHEFNAIAWHTPDPESPGDHLRQHTSKNTYQHAAFLAETKYNPESRKDILDWFMTLPLWLDLPGLRAVHACWHPEHIAYLQPLLQSGNRFDAALIEKASRSGSAEFHAVEAILKGPEVELPDGMQFCMGDEVRREARTRWWDTTATTFRQSAIVDKATRPSLPDIEIPENVRFGYAGDKPVFIGHYWMTGQPTLLAPRVACVDYSAGKGGPLVAYRWDGESELDQRHFVGAEIS